MNIKYLLASTIGLFLGIILAFKIDFSSQVFIVSLVITILNFSIYKFLKPKNNKSKNETPIFLIFLFLFISLGIIFGQLNLSKLLSHKQVWNDFVSEKNNFSGIITDIKQTEKSQQLIVKLTTETKKTFKVELITNKITNYQTGEILSFTGKINTKNVLLPSADDDYNQSFNLENRNNLENISATISFPKITILGEKNNVFYSLRNLKTNLVKVLDKVAPRSVAALSSGTTLGDQSLFTKSEIESFRASGLSHIMVLSGFNITILILFFGVIFLMLNLSLKWRVVLSLLSISIFILIVGAQASILRAGIMGSLLLLSMLFGKPYLAKSGLFLSAIIMMILNPKIAPFDISFHLSFLATLGILYIYPILENYNLLKIKNTKTKIIKNLVEIFILTLSVQIIITPYLAFTFNNISLLSTIANILIVPIVPIIMLLTILIIIFNFIFSPIAIFFGYISYFFTKYIFLIAEYFSSFSISKISTHLSIYTLIILYIILIFLIYFEDKRLRFQKYLRESNT